MCTCVLCVSIMYVCQYICVHETIRYLRTYHTIALYRDLMETVSYKNTPKGDVSTRHTSVNTPTATSVAVPRHLRIQSPPTSSKTDLEDDLQVCPYLCAPVLPVWYSIQFPTYIIDNIRM